MLRRTLPWRSLGQAQALVNGHINEVTIEPEVVPIIFVPGIMGTRLTSARGMVWDPDDAAGFCYNFGLRFGDLKSRVRAMLGPTGYDPHHLWVPNRGAQLAAKDSWSNLVQSSYGKLGQALTQTRASLAVRLCLHMPAYAFAYNWTQSPEQSGHSLKEFIEAVISKHDGAHRCDKVLLVTHSMGGLVARAAMVMHGVSAQVLGVVHAMMPTAGAPVLYQRMKRGFAPPPIASALHHAKDFAQGSLFAALMGATGTGVARVLGHMPGALSLLPSHLYRAPDGAPGWLTLQHRVGGPVVDALPQVSDVYDDVYRRQDGPVRLYDRPPNCTHMHVPCREHRCWHKVQEAIDGVEHLHRRLGLHFHSNSHHIVGTGLPTPSRARFLTLPDASPRDDVRLATGVPALSNHRPVFGLSTRLDEHDDGDGTVPVASALCGLAHSDRVSLVRGVEHSMAMADGRVLELVRSRIQAMAHNYIASGLLAGDP